MKYEIKEQEDGSYVLLRYGVWPLARSAPNNAELEFWFRIKELETQVQQLKEKLKEATNK
jgi:uncharacterized protein YceH (UPF0502 family)